jgi:hypothetical protein
MDLRAFSVKQPWAGLLMAGVKRFEAQSWPPKEPGLFLVYVSSGKAPGMPELRTERLFQKSLREAQMTDERAWPQSAFIGLVEVTEIIAAEAGLPRGFTMQDKFLCGGVDDIFLWRVGRRWPFTRPIPCHGMLNLWRPPRAVHAALNAQLARAGAPAQVRISATRA